jgi:hypothetical protein
MQSNSEIDIFSFKEFPEEFFSKDYLKINEEKGESYKVLYCVVKKGTFYNANYFLYYFKLTF